MNYILLIFSVVLGTLIAIFTKPEKRVLQLLLSFSGAYLLSMTVLHLLPEVFHSEVENIGLYILIGVIIQTSLEYFSKGAEHGHVHIHANETKVPWILFISLYLHAFLEGLPLGLQSNNELLWAIVVHKIPVAAILVIFLMGSKLKKIHIFTIIALFSVASPLGNLFGNKINLIQTYHTQINAVIIGIFLHISTAILFETSANHKFNLQKFLAIIIGFLVAFLGAH